MGGLLIIIVWIFIVRFIIVGRYLVNDEIFVVESLKILGYCSVLMYDKIWFFY